jgi:hypothetical protein
MFAPMSQQPRYRSHYLPRTRDGWIATLAFLLLFALCMPPVTHTLLNRTEPWMLGTPFLYSALFLVYCGLIAVLVWALRRGV